MATERRPRRAAVALPAVVATVAVWTAVAAPRVGAAGPSSPAAPTAVAGSPSPSPAATPPQVPESEPWWVPVGLRGRPVTAVTAAGRVLRVVAGGRPLRSSDGGATFAPDPCPPPACGPATPPRGGIGAAVTVRTPTDAYAVRDGHVLHGPPGGPLTPDPGAPDLGGGAHLLAVPASLPWAAVAVDTGGTVWRRGADGAWARALLLLPQGLTLGPPRVTAVTAFSARPLSDAVYLGTDGYAMLQTDNGGDDWIRAAPGLPSHVLALVADDAASAVYAGTDDGLWVHHLRVEPTPPVYPGTGLVERWLGIVAVCAAGCALALGGLRAAVRRCA